MIDMHIHILPGFDDGAEDMEEAMEMAWSEVDSGVTAIVATSHAGFHFHRIELLERKQQYMTKLEAFRRELRKREIPLAVYPGMEILAERGVTEAIREGKLLTLNHSRYVLMEFLFDERREQIEETVHGLRQGGYGIVMAHPERYDCVKRNPGLLIAWKKEGIYYQLNKGSLLGQFGRNVRRTAEWMLYHDLVDMVASDAHDTVERRAGLEDVRFLLEEICGIRRTERLLSERARRLFLK